MPESDPSTVRIPVHPGSEALVDADLEAAVSGYVWMLVSGYATTLTEKGRALRMHRLVAKLSGYEIRGLTVDHVSGDRLDNRRANLRPCTQDDNAKNRAGSSGHGHPVFKGLTWCRKTRTWMVFIVSNGTRMFLGRFGDAELAARIYDAAAVDHHGEFARLNLPDNPLPGVVVPMVTRQLQDGPTHATQPTGEAQPGAAHYVRGYW